MSDRITIATAGVEGNDPYLTFRLIGHDTSQTFILINLHYVKVLREKSYYFR